MSLQYNLEVLADVYRAARRDLYVSGLSALVPISPDRIVDLSSRCDELWNTLKSSFFNQLIFRAVANH